MLITVSFKDGVSFAINTLSVVRSIPAPGSTTVATLSASVIATAVVNR